MSLQLAAQHLASKGRGRDTRLIHVSPRELQGLQALAKAKGGSLTINPDTGLPEAGFLEDILPIAATAALMFVPGGPALAGTVGGAMTGGLATGALATGIGTGLLAGGASLLGNALSGNKLDFGKAATTGALSGIAGGMGYTAPTTDPNTTVAAIEAAKATPSPFVKSSTELMTLPGETGNTLTPEIGKSFFGSLSPKETLGYGLAGTAALSLLGENNQQSNTNQDPSPAYIRPYTFSQTRNPQYGEPGQSYFNQSYTAQPAYRAAGGGLMDAAMYPQSGMDKTQYATPTQMPTSAEVIRADYDAVTNPYTGDQTVRFAEGGDTKDAVKAYNDILAKRSTEEYVNGPLLAAFRSAPPPPAQAQAVATPDMGGGIKGLYQYYLGRQPSEAEMPQFADQIRSTGMATPEEAAYFRQFIGGEQAATGFKPTGADPFSQQQSGQGLPGSGLMGSGLMGSGMMNPGMMDGSNQQRGMPTFAYNPRTRQYSSTGFMPPPIDMMAPMGPAADPPPGYAAGGMMPDDLVRSYDEGGKTKSKKMDLSEKQKDKILFDFIVNSLEKRPGDDPFSSIPQGVSSRAGLSAGLGEDSRIRAGLSGAAMALPGQTGVRGMPGAVDVGYSTKAGPGNLDLSAFRSINQMPGKGYAQGVNARYSVPFAEGGQTEYNLGGYSDGGRMLKGPGDGMSDSIPGVIGGRQPARLADGEFVVPADVVSHLGNGSTDAGAKKLYAMMDKVRQARVGTKKQGKQIKAEKYIPK